MTDKVAIPCEVCNADLSSSGGWVAWWDKESEPVREFTATCKGACLNEVCSRAGGKENHSTEVYMCIGDLAMEELVSILSECRWEPRSKPLEKLLAFFLLAAKATPPALPPSTG